MKNKGLKKKPIDKVSTERLDMVLRACGINMDYTLIDKIIDIVERLNGKSIFRVNIPVPFVKLTASVNLMAAKVFGGSPMLTPGKVKELIHPNWVADNDLLSSETGWLPKVLLEEGLRNIFGPVM